MKGLLVKLIRAGLRRGLRDGVLEGNRTWLVVGGVALVAHLAGRVVGREEATIFSEALQPGETFTITHVPNP